MHQGPLVQACDFLWRSNEAAVSSVNTRGKLAGWDKPGKMVIIFQDGTFLKCVVKGNFSTSVLVNFGTVDILDWIIFLCVGLSSAL